MYLICTKLTPNGDESKGRWVIKGYKQMKFANASDTYLKRKLNVSAKQLDEKLKEITLWFIENNADDQSKDKLKSLLDSGSLVYLFKHASATSSDSKERYTILEISVFIDHPKGFFKRDPMPNLFVWRESLEEIKKAI